ncbi:MAG: tetratricopeptide repeat protein [Flavobacteriales bacterium]|jgi:class 3 adenylate cyclase/tetratricopeptide (TPR) repeat protein|nr:tetratricopeptide repeat protein [Flavobacteriales bacterium]
MFEQYGSAMCRDDARLTVLRAALLALVLLAVTPVWSRTSDPAPTWQSLMAEADGLKDAGLYHRSVLMLDSALVVANVDGDQRAIGRLLRRKAVLFQLLGENDRALTVLYQALEVEKGRGEDLGLAEVLNHIGAIQHFQKNYEKAGDYYRRSGEIYQRLGLQRETAKYWNNMGSLYEDRGQPQNALVFHKHGLRIWETLQDTGWIGISDMHLGICQQQLGNWDSARTYLEASIRNLTGRNSELQLAVVYIIYGNNEISAGHPRLALRYCRMGLAMAEARHAKPFEQQACECLSKAYGALGDDGRALAMFRRSVALKDTLFGEARVQEMTRVEMDHEFAQRELADSLTRAKQQVEEELRHQGEVASEREGRNIAIFSGVAVLVLAGGLWSRLRHMRLSSARIQRERERSERLLLNILPASVAQELKDKGTAMARDYPGATILFSDFKDFTRISASMSAQALVEELDTCFKAFDRIITAKGIEKIKTIGDAYMCVGGLPDPTSTDPTGVVSAALEMQAYIAARKAAREKTGLPAFEMRVGIHTGSVVAGIVGMKKFAYDIWGDAVNTASAMESAGEAGKVNISEATFQCVKDEPGFVFTPRGKVQAKGKGEMEMYFVERG